MSYYAYSVYTLGFFSHFLLLVWVNGPAEANDSKIIMVNSCVAFGCTNRSGSGVNFHKIPCDKELQKL